MAHAGTNPLGNSTSGRKAAYDKLDEEYRHPWPVEFSERRDSKLPQAFAFRAFASLIHSWNNILPKRVIACELLPTLAAGKVANLSDMHHLWTHGFFGKGTLSRTNPTWLARQQAMSESLNATASEIITQSRRTERHRRKLKRAELMDQVDEEHELALQEALARQLELDQLPTKKLVDVDMVSMALKDAIDMREVQQKQTPGEIILNNTRTQNALDDEDVNPEYLHLTLCEVFFLTYYMQSLNVSLQGRSVDAPELWRLCQTWQPNRFKMSIPSLRADNPFLIQYVVYHRYRSLGWVIKSGIKFSADYVLYLRGPVFHHAEFALVVIPRYENALDQKDSPYDHDTEPDWPWLLTVHRINAHAKKTVILVYVTIPSSERVSATMLSSPACLSLYRVDEVSMKRFAPARMRE